MTMENEMSEAAVAAIAFKEARESIGLSVRDLAYVLGTREDTVRKWEDPKSFGPNPVAVEALKWIVEDGYVPKKLAEIRQAQG